MAKETKNTKNNTKATGKKTQSKNEGKVSKKEKDVVNASEVNEANAAMPEVATSSDSIPDEEWDKGQRDGLNAAEDEASKTVPFSRNTRIEKYSREVSIKSIFREYKKDQIKREQFKIAVEQAMKDGSPIPEDDGTVLRFDLAIQRNEVWSHYQRSDFIHSILYGIYIQPILIQDSGDGKKWFLDGKQRITTLMTFIDGQWALHKNTSDIFGHKIAGLKFKDLDEEMQDTILSETLTFVWLKNMTDEERDLTFVKQNSGSSLSRIELTRAKHSKLISEINDLARIKFFVEDLELSNKARVRFVDQEIILQIAMLMEDGKENIAGFGANDIEKYVLRMRDEGRTLSENTVKRFKETASYLDVALDGFADLAESNYASEAKKALKKVHVPIIFHCAEQAMSNQLQPKLFGAFIRSFLVENYSINSKYGKACQAKSSSKESVITRLDEMSKALEDFVGFLKNAENEQEAIESFSKKLADENGVDRQLDIGDIA